MARLSTILTTVVFYWFVTQGTGDLIGDKPEVWGTAYDHLARSLSDYQVDVPADSIGLEGIRNNGKTYLYFGPLPALLRILPHQIWPDNFGHWSRISCFIAALLAYATLLAIVRESLAANRMLTDWEKKSWLNSLSIGLGIGSPLLFLVSDSMIFLEAMLWGLCFSLIGMRAAVRYIFGQSNVTYSLIVLGLSASAALLSRVTFSIPLYLLLAYFLFQHIVSKRTLIRRHFDLLVASIAGGIGIIVQLWYNAMRFDSPFISLVYQMVEPNPEKYGGEFNFLRIPISLYNFFGIRLDSFSIDPTYFFSLKPLFLTPMLYMGWSERVISLTLASPWLVLFVLFALFLIFSRKLPTAVIVCFLAFAAQALMILSWHFLTQRYAGDLMPFLCFSIAAVLGCADGQSLRRLRVPVAVLILISIIVTPLTTIDFHLMAVGDTGKVKENRPRLNRLFYSEVSFSYSTGSKWSDLALVPQLQACTVTPSDSLRGRTYQSAVLLPIGCHYSFTPMSKRIRAIVGLSDASHECEQSEARWIIRNRANKEIYRSKPISQRAKLKRVDIKIPNVEELYFTFENQKAESACAKAVLIQFQSSIK